MLYKHQQAASGTELADQSQAPRSASATEPLVARSSADQLQAFSHHIQDTINWQPGLPTSSHPRLSTARTLRSSDKLLLTVPLMALALSVKAFSVSAPSVLNSLSYICRSAKLLSTFKHSLKTELFHIAYHKREHSA